MNEDSKIETAVNRRLDKTNSIYTDDIWFDTGYTRKRITNWLRENGFVKTGGCTSRRWTKSIGRGAP